MNRNAFAGALGVLSLALAGCQSGFFDGSRVDYRSASVKMNPLEIPPDLTQLSQGRYQPQRGGVVTASTINTAAAATLATTSPTSAVAPLQVGDYKVERDGSRRWLSVPRTPEQVWPALVEFWQELGFTLEKKDEASGVIVTNWAENRAKLPQDVIRGSLGGLLGTAYSTGELDQYRTRVERTATGCEIFVTHKGMEEVYTTPQKDFTKWQPRPNDPEMESEMLSRLLVKLGATEAMARAAIANAAAASAPASAQTQAPRARVVSGVQGNAFEIDDGPDRAWRRVGIALDRSGFTVEDRDRAAGLYFVRYVDPRTAGQEVDKGIFSKLFGGSSDSSTAAVKYQVALKADGGKTRVSVLNSQGAPDSSENSKRIVDALVRELQ